jgi:hypothetical protein
MAEWRMLQRNARGRLLEQLRADHLEHIGLIHERTLVLRTHNNIDPDVQAGKPYVDAQACRSGSSDASESIQRQRPTRLILVILVLA